MAPNFGTPVTMTDTHILSNKSRALGRDTFVFSSLNPTPSRLVLGFNQRLTPVSNAKIQRWVRVMTPETRDFVLCAVTVHSAGIFEYYITPSGLLWTLPRPLHCHPGIMVFTTICRRPGQADFARGSKINSTFEDLASTMTNEKRISQYQIPVEIQNRVMARDKQHCRLTGETNDVLAWIIPPPLKQYTARQWLTPIEKSFLVPQNLLTLRTDLVFHFHHNNFSVDVDDEYRIVVLGDMGAALPLLPTFFLRHPDHDENVDGFLRDHFRFSLRLMITGGDIRETYSPEVIMDAVDELVGLGPQYDHTPVQLSDERWQTELGREILTNEIRVKAHFRDLEYNEFDDDEDLNIPTNEISVGSNVQYPQYIGGPDWDGSNWDMAQYDNPAESATLE
ncbi:hypothetical protein C8R46DRAFT_1223837 [Mycena filopes]|nr:hypothetical protein C8R46DRAFT_1223837 [Mycena filopes]